jgi:hypothetical protein
MVAPAVRVYGFVSKHEEATVTTILADTMRGDQ